MSRRDVRKGDWFLLPYRGLRRDLLIRAVSPSWTGHWWCRDRFGIVSLYGLSACHRCPPSLARQLVRARRRYDARMRRIQRELAREARKARAISRSPRARSP